tara:strand:+ start:156 stop:1538 length:1383 start_codon:yes stop_codon:yes gene_type:complete
MNIFRQAPQKVNDFAGNRLGIDSGYAGKVDSSGTFCPPSGDYQIEWWIGEEDRWHKPKSATVYAHRRVGSAPIFETKLFTAAGPITATTWASIGRGDRKPSVVTEVLNQSSAPVALAIVIKPLKEIKQLEVEGSSLVIDGSSRLTVDRPPGYWVLQEEFKSLENVITGGQANRDTPRILKSKKKEVSGALIAPLTHKSGLRFVASFDKEKSPKPEDFPEFSRISAGWDQRLEPAAKTNLPNRERGGLSHADLIELLFSTPTPKDAVLLAAWGLADDAAERIATAQPNTQWLEAAIELWVRHRRVEHFLSARSIKIEPLVRSMGKRDILSQSTVAGLVSLLKAIGENKGAKDLERLGKGSHHSEFQPFGDLVFETSDGIDLLHDFVPPSWYGEDFEAHNLATRWGNLGFAVRWHGANPALLWEIEAHEDSLPRITISGLDPEFSTFKTEGETLLSPPVTDN